MKAWILKRPGDPASLEQMELDSEPLGSTQARVRIKAVSINNRDTMILANQYKSPVMPGRVPLSDAVGEVVEIGSAVTRVSVGDCVSPSFFEGWISGPLRAAYMDTDLGGSVEGVLTQQRIFDEQTLVALAPHLSDDQAATLCCAGITAWNSLRGCRPAKP